jgi:hypothetical protein
MPIVGGLDIHRKQITFDYQDTVTGQVRRGQIAPADREHLRAWLARFSDPDDVAFAVEGCTGWRYVAEELAAAGVAAHLAEPAGTTFARAVGDCTAGDTLIRDGKIAQVGEDLARQAGEAVVIDAAGTIAVPGFVDTHVHAWEGQLRRAVPMLDFGAYLSFTAFGYGPHYRPHDNYVGTLATALVALDAGITTIVDNSHNSRTPEHSSAAVEALIDSGIRGVHASGAPVGADLPTWPADVTRLRSEYFTSEDQATRQAVT